MIRCVKDLSPDLGYRELPLKRSRYRFLDLSLEIRSNSCSLRRLVDGIYGAFSFSEVGPETIVSYLLEEMEDTKTPYRTIDPGFDSFLCSDFGRAVSFWGAQLMCNHLFRLPSLFIHGAVLESAGRAFVFTGPSGGGKTTFILSLGEEGFSFYSDEFAPLSLSGGEIHPFPRSLFLGREQLDQPAVPKELPSFLDYQEKKPGDQDPPRRFILSPERIFAVLGRGAIPPAAFCFLDGFSDRGTTTQPLSAGQALERLLPLIVNTPYLSFRAADPAIEMLVATLSRAPAYLIYPGPPDEDPAVRARIIKELAKGIPEGLKELKAIGRRCGEILRQRNSLCQK